MAKPIRALALALTLTSFATIATPGHAAADPDVAWGYRFTWSTNPDVTPTVCNIDGRGLVVTGALTSGTCTTRLAIVAARGPNVVVLATDVTDLGKVRLSDTTFKVKVKLNYTQRGVSPADYPSFDAGWLYLTSGTGLAVTDDPRRATVFSTAPGDDAGEDGAWLQGVALTSEHQIISGAWPQPAWLLSARPTAAKPGKPVTRVGLAKRPS